MSLKQASLFDIAPVPEQKEREAIPAPETAASAGIQTEAPVETKPAPAEADPEIREVEFIAVPPPAKKSPKAVIKSTRGRMRLSDLHINADLIEVPEDEELFQKSYYSIGAVSEMFKVNISLIRFWENEFDILKPKKNGKGDRLFRPEDVKNLKMIYHLLREKKYTIEGAKDFLKRHKKAEENFAVIESLKKLKLFLNELKANF
jgi:DNA-binding transcriptional MerR regulator